MALPDVGPRKTKNHESAEQCARFRNHYRYNLSVSQNLGGEKSLNSSGIEEINLTNLAGESAQGRTENNLVAASSIIEDTIPIVNGEHLAGGPGYPGTVRKVQDAIASVQVDGGIVRQG